MRQWGAVRSRARRRRSISRTPRAESTVVKIIQFNADGARSEAGDLAAAKGLESSNGVFRVAWSGISPGDQLYANTSMPLFSNFPVNPMFATAKNLFSAQGAYGSTASQGPTSTLFAQKQGVTSVALLSHNSQTGIAAAAAIGVKANSLGLKTVYTNNAIPLSSFDATSVAIAIKDSKADGVFLELARSRRDLDREGVANAGLHAEVHPHSVGVRPGCTDREHRRRLLKLVLRALPRSDQHVAAVVAGLPECTRQVRPGSHVAQYAVAGYANATLFMHGLQLAGNCPTQEAWSRPCGRSRVTTRLG